jgi:hypothetical protein
MPVPHVESLRADRWKLLNPTERLEALQELENELAKQRGDEPCLVVGKNLGENILGWHTRSNTGPDTIEINSELISRDQPYEAVETLFHEDRHAYQVYAIQHPGTHDNLGEVEDWRKNLDGGYIEDTGLNYDYYRWQPVEADANQIARERTDELYLGMFQDSEKYPDYRAEKEQEISRDIEHAKMNIGDNYQEKARQKMIEKYQGKLKQQESESEDYYYGHGY